MLANCKNLTRQILEEKQKLENMKSCFGKHIMYDIIYHATNKPPSIAGLISKCNSKTAKYATVPLMELEINGQNYQMILDRIDKHVAGEYKTYEDIIKLATLPEEFSDQLEFLDKVITENAIAVYDSLKSNFRNSNTEFKMISRSEKKRYLYYYRTHQKESFGLLFIEV